MIRKIVGALTALTVCGSLAACGASNADGKTLSILVEGGSPAETVAKDTAAGFEKLTGYNVKVDTVPYSGLYDKLKAETMSRRGVHDVAFIDVGWFPALKKGLLPVEDVLSQGELNDLMPMLRDGGTFDGHLLGVPTWTNSKVLLYRKDLFSDPANKKAFKQKYGYELTVPKTWDQYRDVAKFFTHDGMYGTGMIGVTGSDSVTGWLEFATQAGADGLVVDKNGKVDLTDGSYAKALEYMRELAKDGSIPADYLSLGTSEISNLFNQGKLAMQLNWSHFYKSSASELGEDKVGAAPMIGGSAGIGAIPGPWYESILSNSNKQEIAKDYLKYMYGQNERYMTSLGVAARRSVLSKYENKPGYAHLKALEATLDSPQTQNRPAIRAWTEIEIEVLSPLVQKVLKNGNAEAELAKAQKKVEGILG